MPYEEFDTTLKDIDEKELEKIRDEEGVKHLSKRTCSDPAFPVLGNVHGLQHMKMSEQTYYYSRYTSNTKPASYTSLTSPLTSSQFRTPNRSSSDRRFSDENDVDSPHVFGDIPKPPTGSSEKMTHRERFGPPPSLLRNNMATFNSSSSYNRTYEKKVIEEGAPRVRVTTQTHAAPIGGVIPDISSLHQNMLSHFPNLSVSPSAVNFANAAGCVTSLRTTDTSFNATLDVSMYDSDTLKVSVVDQFIVIEGSHGEKEDTFGTIERTFKRKFALPKNIPAKSVTSQLTADGMLTIEAKAPEPKLDGARAIPIKVVTTANGGASGDQK
ncbi:unnamed protein product [Caenorhabditis bovis]|uniref:SHSP domain-containing protein n=1 Tax=Caenorhabditis bovis TaxID=2654633 RepID=A0A8S1FAN3_9PELO|nr:unnamed protein product [Caenorhabditis bovis]